MNGILARLRRHILRVGSAGRGEVRLLQSWRYFREISYFAVVFALLILGPAILLAWFSWDSTSAVESSFDLELRLRGESAVRQVEEELSGIFRRFEGRVEERVQRGESLVSDLQQLSPFLRAAFRFGPGGRLESPFVLPSDDPAPPPSPRVAAAMERARATEATVPRDALAAWSAALALARGDPPREAEARLGVARGLWRAGQEQAAQRELENIFSEFASLRDENGLRFGDLALLQRAEIGYARDPDAGASALQALVEQLLGTPWTVGRRDGPAIARHALALVEVRSDPDWVARTRSRLNELNQQLYWASSVERDLDLLDTPVPDLEPGRFLYVPARSGSASLWVQLDQEGLYAFSFSVPELQAELTSRAAQVTQFDRDLVAVVTDAATPPPENVLASATLANLPIAVSAIPADPAALARMKSTRRGQRAAVVALAVLLVGVGVVLSARIVGREIETARMKADFAANVSHELRSPITQIRLKAEALQLGLTFDEDDTRAHYDAIVKQSERLSRLVDNVLDFASIERGAKRYQLRPDDLAPVVLTAIEAARPAIAEAKMKLDVSLPHALPRIAMDREAIGQVVTNLLSNAVKYGRSGGWVGVSVRTAGDRVEIAVSDRGMGIAPRDAERVFEHFFRSQDPNVRKMKGTGIGLTICRYIVEAHGGMITVDSAPGQGATFLVTLPVHPPEQR